jgi:hypothetical protein
MTGYRNPDHLVQTRLVVQEAAQDRPQQYITGPGVTDEDDSKQRHQRPRRDVVEPIEHANSPSQMRLQPDDAM